jgi:hypothetical protein
MKLFSLVVAVAVTLRLESSSAWAPSHSQQKRPAPPAPKTTSPSQHTQTDLFDTTTFGRVVSSAFVAAALWGSPLLPLDVTSFHPPSAVAKEMASGSGSRVNKDAESLLRYGLPIKNTEVSEDIFQKYVLNQFCSPWLTTP